MMVHHADTNEDIHDLIAEQPFCFGSNGRDLFTATSVRVARYGADPEANLLRRQPVRAEFGCGANQSKHAQTALVKTK